MNLHYYYYDNNNNKNNDHDNDGNRNNIMYIYLKILIKHGVHTPKQIAFASCIYMFYTIIVYYKRILFLTRF